VDSALCAFDDATVPNPTLTCDDNGSYNVTLTVSDGWFPPVSSGAVVTVNNVGLTIDGLTAPVAPVGINDQSPVNAGVSSNYEWLVIAAANAKYKGEGDINGEGVYKFMLTATDGDLLCGGNIKIHKAR
jgi:hypothetical protein